MSHSSARVVYWSPRVLGVLFTGFIALFALDVFEQGRGFWATGLALLVHLIPSAILAAILVIAWRWEWMGAGLYSLMAAFYAVSVLPQHVEWAVAIAGPMLVIAGLFLTNWMERGKVQAAL